MSDNRFQEMMREILNYCGVLQEEWDLANYMVDDNMIVHENSDTCNCDACRSLCPSCRRDRHQKHTYDFMSREGRVKICRCELCKTKFLKDWNKC